MRRSPWRAALWACTLALFFFQPARAAESDLENSPSRIPDEVIPPQEDDVPERTPPIIELGDPFLGIGDIHRGFELPTGAVWNPSLQIFGTLRTAVQGIDNRQFVLSEWANRLDIFGNLQLSGTERVLVGFRPFDESGAFSGYRFEPDDPTVFPFMDDGFVRAFDGVPQTLFFEGDLGEVFLPRLDRKDRWPLDLGLAVGRQRFVVQDGMLLNDTIDAVGIIKNTLLFPYTSNFRATGVFGWRNIHRGNNARDPDALLGALFTEADTRWSTIAADFVYVESVRSRGAGFFAGVSATQRLGALNSTFRVNTSVPLDGETLFVTRGTLLFAEFSFTPHGTNHLIYLSGFWAINEFSSAARSFDAGGPLGQVGILYEAVGLGRYGSALSNDTVRAAGGALGFQFFLGSIRRQLLIELGGRGDTDGSDRGQLAAAARFQQAVWTRLIFQLDGFVSGRESATNPSYGGRVELQLKL